MAAMTIARGLREKRSAAKSDQALRRVLSFLDHNNNHKIRLEDFIDMMEEHSVEMEAEEVLELCELTEVTGEICHSTLIIFIKNAKVWRFLEKQQVPTEGTRTRIEAISAKVNKVHAAFNVLDSDRDGFVTKSDFRQKFQNLNSRQIDVVFQRYDRSSHGRLSFVEFKNFMTRRPLPARLESRRASLLSLPNYSSLHPSQPPSYQSLGLEDTRGPPTYASLPGDPPSYSSLGYPEETEGKEEEASQLSSLSRTCTESLEELHTPEEGEEEGEEEEETELSTISEEQGEV